MARSKVKTLDLAIRHTIVHHSSTSTYIPNLIEIEETFCGRTDVRTDIFSPLILLGRLLEVDLKTVEPKETNDELLRSTQCKNSRTISVM